MPVSSAHRPARAIAGSLIVTGLVAASVLGIGGAANAAEIETLEADINPVWSTTDPWSLAYQGGTAAFSMVDDPDAPLGTGALEITTPANADYIGIGHTLATAVGLADVDFSYASKRIDGPVHAATSIALMVDLDGDLSTSSAADFMYAIFEPVYNYPVATTDYDVWNTWDILPASQFWYSGAHNGNFFSGAYTATLNQVLAVYPDAVVTGMMFNQGTGNPDWLVRVDAFDDGTDVYNFERVAAPVAPAPAPDPSLADTGGELQPIVLAVGAVLLALGGALVVVTRRARRTNRG